MNWNEVHFQVPTDKVELAESLLMLEDALSVTLTDAGDQPLLEPAPGQSPLWDDVVVTGLFPEEAPTEDLLARLGQKLEASRAWASSLEDQEWERSWMDHFKPIDLGHDLWIVPTWFEEVPNPEATNLRLDPGLAFGTGHHQSTRLCLSWLASLDLKDLNVLDYGCGSGILGVAALLLGASSCDAVDIDPLAVKATYDNAKINQVDQQIWAGLPQEHNTETSYHIVVANILARPLVELAGHLASMTQSGGRAVLAGLIEEQLDMVTQAYEPWFKVEAVHAAADGGWRAVSLVKKPSAPLCLGRVRLFEYM